MECLYFNSDELIKDIRLDINSKIDKLFYEFESLVYNSMDWQDAIQKRKIEKKINSIKEDIELEIIANAYVIADSFGTGRKSNLNKNEYNKYKGNESAGWNPLRTNKAIVGRKAGKYIDFFGEEKESQGTMRGVKLNEDNFPDFEEIAPSSALQDALKDLLRKGIPDMYKEVINNINYSKYFSFR